MTDKIRASLQNILVRLKELECLGMDNTIEYNKLSEDYQCLAMSLVEDDIFDEDGVQ